MAEPRDAWQAKVGDFAVKVRGGGECGAGLRVKVDCRARWARRHRLGFRRGVRCSLGFRRLDCSADLEDEGGIGIAAHKAC
jgi:hypothetical protein